MQHKQSFISNMDLVKKKKKNIPAKWRIQRNYASAFNIQTNATGNATYFIRTNHSSSFTLLNNKTGSVQFNPTLLVETIFIGVRMDATGFSATLQPKILYCHCLNNGICDYNSIELNRGKLIFVFLIEKKL